MITGILWLWMATFALITWATNSWLTAFALVLGFLALACWLAGRKAWRQSR